MAVENRLIDTNILVYAYDVSEKVKRQVARSLLDEVWVKAAAWSHFRTCPSFLLPLRVKSKDLFLP